MTTIVEKKQISVAQFEKEVEIESAYLQHYNHLTKEEADEKAKAYVAEKYITTQ